ncbi:NACHT and TPR domain protein [Aspergillus aurantiobrunneus]
MAQPRFEIPAIHEKAIRKYREITNNTIDVAGLSGIHSVEDLSAEIDRQNKEFLNFRERRGTLFHALGSALAPVQIFDSLAAGPTSTFFPPSILVFGAVTHLLRAAEGVSAAYDAIQELMVMLQDFTIRLGTYTQETISAALSDKFSDILAALIEVLALATKTIQRGRLRTFAKNLLWGSADPVHAALERLDKLTRVEEYLVGAETLTESKRTGRVVSEISVVLSETNTAVVESGRTVDQMSRQVDEIQEALGNLVVSVNQGKQQNDEALQDLVRQTLLPSRIDSAKEWYDKINKARVPGTGDWVLKEHVFQSWIKKDKPILFMSGNPGAGKSFLAARIISFLQEKTSPGQENSPVSLGYFFFRNDDPQTRSFHQALRDIAFQLSRSDPAYQRYLGATIKEHEEISTLESAWRLLFVDYLLKVDVDRTAYVVLDGVDEALDEELSAFISLATDLHTNRAGHLQLAIIGRPYISDQLLEGLEENVPTIHVTKHKNTDDISQYIHTSIKKSLILRKISTKLRQEIISKLSANAEGMFLWVNLMLQELSKKRNETSMRKALEQSPRGLREMFRHVLASFSASSDEEELEFLNEVLLWVACADQPWKLGQLEAIIKLKSPEGDGMIDLEGSLRRQWASFFTLNREDGLTTAELEGGIANLDAFMDSDGDEEDNPDDEELTDFNSNKNTTTVNFSHASIREFLIEGKVSAGEGLIAVGVDYREAKAHVLKTYLRLISDSDFASKADDSGRMLLSAQLGWGKHLRATHPSECSLDDKCEIIKALLTVFRSEEAMLNWTEGYDWESPTATINAIRPWWQEQDVLEFLTRDETEFISTVSSDPIALLRPVVESCTKRWLCEDRSDLFHKVTVIWRYQLLIKGEEIDPERYITAEEIIQAAELGGSEKTASWFRRCAAALRQMGYHDEGLQSCEKAVELDPDDWRTLREMAQTYHELEDWSASIEWWERARLRLSTMLAESPEDGSPWKARLHECLERTGQTYEHLGDKVKRFETFQEAYKHAPSCWICIYALLQHHNDGNAHEATMALLKHLADTPAAEGDLSQLTEFFLVNVFDVDLKSRLAADAALATNNLDFVLQNLRIAARAARQKSRTLIAAELDMACARIYKECLDDHAKAIKCWERITDIYSSHMASSNLGQAFLHLAVEAGVGSLQADAVVAKLENLVQQSQSYPMVSFASVPAVYLGIYRRLQGQDEQARALIRPSVQRSFQMLDDNYTANRESELSDLCRCLLAAADWKNAIAIARRSGDDGDDATFDCRGRCGRRARIQDGYSVCSICLDLEVKFCPDCASITREPDEDGTARATGCTPMHWKYLISIPRRLQEIGGGKMLVDGEEKEFKAWRSRLKEEWNLDDSKPSSSTMDFSAFSLGIVA